MWSTRCPIVMKRTAAIVVMQMGKIRIALAKMRKIGRA